MESHATVLHDLGAAVDLLNAQAAAGLPMDAVCERITFTDIQQRIIIMP